MHVPLVFLLAAMFGRDLPPPRPGLERVEQLRTIHGGRAAPGAWLALWRGDAWVCWRPGPGCWQRLELAGVVDVALLRAEFTGLAALVLGDRSETTWRIDQGDPTPRPATGNPTGSPQVHACGPDGALPIAEDGGGLSLALVPCAEAPAGESVCVSPGRGAAVRPVVPVRVRLGLELRVQDAWSRTTGPTATTGMAVLATLSLGWSGGFAHRRERADLQAQARPGLRTLPALRSRGPLAAAEREALAAVLCGGDL